ncbi:uncharacterized protein EV420DRAFT_676565 [Desarmillaria tabescens]|uniref:C2H2-type domain-containing protein n=1 Tax=Armillaria tabescens TaxID=1929756 RepID=A0AA39NKF0_ARMTA|nr:uncharacterized protein EV420DRAFT_676565 [Desarmillaria tabescens]KAK0467302.1 hypothetical protein EV420DRAFT_676565 [Desarmillaria tabescens]
MTTPSTVELTVDSYLDISRTTVIHGHGLRCDYVLHGKESKECGAVLSCWEAMSKHLFVHCICRRVHDKGTGVKHAQYECPLPRCSAPIHASERSIREHIDMSHMPIFHALICPFQQCEGTSFTRSSHLTSHLHSAHAALIGQRVDQCSKLFLPSSRMFRPSSLPDPPPLRDPSMGAVLLPVVANGPPRKSLSWATGASQTPGPSLPRSPQRLKYTVSESLIDDKNSSSIILDDLPAYDRTKYSSLQTDLVIWHRPPPLQRDVVRPLPMLDPAVPRPTEPPGFILFNPFKSRVDALAQQIEAGLSVEQD